MKGVLEKLKNKKLIVISTSTVAALVIVVVAGISIYRPIKLESQMEGLVKGIDEGQIAEYINKKDALVSIWDNLGFLKTGDKKNIVEELTKIQDELTEFELTRDHINVLKDRSTKYSMGSKEYDDYMLALKRCDIAVQNEEAASAISLFEDVRDKFNRLIKSNESYIQMTLKVYSQIDMTNARDEDITNYNLQMDKLNELITAEHKDYSEIKQEFGVMDNIVARYAEAENPLDIKVQQVDVSQYPNIKMYVEVQDATEIDKDAQDDTTSEKDLSNLAGDLFYIKKEDIDGHFVRQSITNATKLTNNEALKLDIVADISKNMTGAKLDAAKDGICNFIGNVEFQSGDMVEITSYGKGVQIEQEFSNRYTLLTSKINSLKANTSASLYDALYTATVRTGSQNGARCVIAFTDGEDNYSKCSADDVIEQAKKYRVPIFIIGVGDGNYNKATRIAKQTGGAFYSAKDTTELEDTFNEIYNKEKNMYMIEFQDKTGIDGTNKSIIKVGYNSIQYGGENAYNYEPNILLNVNSDNLYTKGAESTVEKYLRGYESASTNQQLDSFDITKADYRGNKCTVETLETYYMQAEGKTLELVTQRCEYELEQAGDSWVIKSTSKPVIVSKINQ